MDVSPEVTASGEGHADHPSLTIQFREPAVFYQMPTVRMNLPRALLSGDMKLRGDLRLFLRMSKLFSVDARP